MTDGRIPREFDPVRILEVLDRHGVAFIVVGGVAATLHGSPQATYDLDVAYERSSANVDRLIAALTELDAVRVTDPSDPSPPSAESLTERIEHFTSPVGAIDVLAALRSVGGYEDLTGDAEEVEIKPGLTVLVAGIDSIIWSKSGTGRAKDPAHIRSLEQVRDERRRGPRDGT